MTTIAANRSLMAGDSWCVPDGGDRGFLTDKIYRGSNGSVFGLCGDDVAWLLMEWLISDRREPRPEFREGDDFWVLELDPTGQLWLWDKRLVRTRIIADDYAIGSGCDVALYCMRVHKMTPQEAVVEACKLDIDNSKLPVRWMALDGSEG